MTLAAGEPMWLLDQGGPLIWVQAALAIAGGVLLLERMFFFHRARLNVGDVLIGLSNHVRRKAFAEALHEAGRVPGPVGRVLHAVLLRHHLGRADLRAIAQESGQLEVPRIEKNIRAVLGVALLAPLAGMLGTVLGLLETFQLMGGQGGFASPAEISAGVFQALITTAVGLTVAIPNYLFYLYLLGRAQRLVHRIERAGIEMVNMLADSHEERDIVSFREERAAISSARTEKAGKP